MSKGHTLQDPYLNALRKERIPVSIYLVNTVSQMVYKHAISTVVPSRNVRIPLTAGADGEEGSESE